MLNDAELRSLGLKGNYGAAVASAGIEFVHYPIVEGAGAGDHTGTMQAAHAVVVGAASVLQRGENSVMHCRGGVGRAGMMAACLRLFTREATTPKHAIGLVRKRRCKQAVETRRQEDFVKRYYIWLTETGVLQPVPVATAASTATVSAAGSAAASRSAVLNPAERQAAAEQRRQQAKERREAARATTKAQSGDSKCCGKTGCSCVACATSAAVLGCT